MRPSRHQTFMEIARVVAKRSTCMRLNVGAVIVHNRRIISLGFNGSPEGQPHCQGNECPGKDGCKLTVHAEMNALQHIPEGTMAYGSDLYVTDSPCAHCFHSIAEDGRIGRIFFQTPYRVNEHLTNSLLGKDIEIYQLMPAGYIIEWESRRMVDVED